MKTKLQLAAFALLLAALNAHHSTAFAQGSLTPPGAPAPTMKTLDQIETRIPISGLPYSISAPGSYYITTNLLVAVNNGIVITANNVTLDLNGFTISSIQNPASTGKAIALGSGSGPVANVTIRNGFITGGVTNNGGTFGGSGFGYGIFQFGGQPSVNVHVSGVTVSGCLYVGIHLGGSNTVVESCNVNTAGSYGIYAQTVADSTAQNCGIYAIYATETANNCSGTGTGNGSGVSATTANNCHGIGAGSGSGIIAATANNCHGTGAGSGSGIIATNVNNCYGIASGTGDGVYAITANNCYGTSASGNGLRCLQAAQNCYGISTGGNNGIYTGSALNCYGQCNNGPSAGILAINAENCSGYNTGYGYGLDAVNLANGCYGQSNSGTGLHAFIASLCHGDTISGTPLTATHNVNSY